MKNGRAKKNKRYSLLLLLALLVGLSLLLYPTISNCWNSFHQSKTIATYVETVAEMDDSDYEGMWREAQAYNTALPRDQGRFQLSEEEKQVYEGLLRVSDDGIMGYVEIPSINVELPIYHGTDEEILLWGISKVPHYRWAGPAPIV